MSLALQVAGRTDVGCVRTNNEDAFGYDAGSGVFVVCDGVGGNASGEVASQIGVSTLLEYFERARQTGEFPQFGEACANVSTAAGALASAIRLANAQIRRVAAEEPSRTGMGSTIAAGVVADSHVAIAHVGDSRIYRIRGDDIQQLTRDHSFVMEQVARGLISEAEAEQSPVKNYILRALGADNDVEPDVADLAPEPGDLLLLSSDGLTRHVSNEQIAEIINAAPSLDHACEALIAAAKQAGGSDNITCVLVRLEEQPRSDGAAPGNGSGAAHKGRGK